ncbi:unnamed protein product [Peronospora belbahrii]|uniref:Uncharacterized protein n=1 Tax=Peronospora belbahrii TaxID=622444 RepID=A0ABN8CZ72_9STRA|nr:unnamed protein product [Peronospora belbahrii]
MTKSRQTAEASTRILYKSVHAIHAILRHMTSKALNLVVHPVLRAVLFVFLVLALLLLAVMNLGRLELWMTGAGLVMVAMSVASAVQEFKFPRIVPSYQEFLDQEMEKCGCDIVTLPPRLPLVKGNAVKKQQQVTKDATSSMTLNIAPAASSPFPLTFPKKTGRRGSEYSIEGLKSAINTTVVETCVPRNTITAIEVGNKLDLLHCGTVIDIQGSLGFIIPHDLRIQADGSCKSTWNSSVAEFDRAGKQQKIPLIIPFNLNEDRTGTRQKIAVGNTVKFAYSNTGARSDSPSATYALSVTLVPTDDGIVKSRSALQSCKQAREVSFARAMEELTMISPRNEPVKHQVDLIKYAEKLDNLDTPFD